jgi:hypothetical protein
MDSTLWRCRPAIIAHVDRGKSTLTDSLVGKAACRQTTNKTELTSTFWSHFTAGVVCHSLVMFPVAALEAVTPDAVNQAVDLFEVVKQLRLRLTNVSEEVLDRAFESHIQNVLEKLDKRIPFLTDQSAKSVEVVMAKHGLCDAAFQQIILLCQHISPALGEVLKQLRNTHSEFFSELQFVSNEYLRRMEEQEKSVQESKQQHDLLEKECDELLAATKLLDQVPSSSFSTRQPLWLGQEAEENNQLILELRKQLRETLAEVNSVKASGKKAGAGWKSQSGSQSVTEEALRPSFDTSLQADVRGRKLFDNMKRTDPHVTTHSPASASALFSSSQTEFKPQSSFMLSSTMTSSSSPSSHSPLASLSSLNQWLLSIRKEIQLSLDSNSIRAITPNECRDLVLSIFDSRQQSLQKIKQKIQSAQHDLETNGPPSLPRPSLLRL